MAKITAVILPAKALKLGKHKVRIAIAHNSEMRYIATDIILDSDKEFKNGLIIKRALRIRHGLQRNSQFQYLMNREFPCNPCLI